MSLCWDGVGCGGYGWKVVRKKAKAVKKDELRDGSEEMMFLIINLPPSPSSSLACGLPNEVK